MKTFLALLVALTAVTAHASAEDNWNVRTKVFELLGGLANLRLDRCLGEQWTVGPEISYRNWKTSGVNLKATTSFGLTGTYSFAPAFADSWFIEIGADYEDVHAEATDSGGQAVKADFTNFSVRGLGGYHWFWDTFNFSLGFGLASNSKDKIQVKNAAGQVIKEASFPTLTLDATAGMTF
jgi:hypothetical protein